MKQRTTAIRQYPLIGDPDRVADLLVSLNESGFDGIGLTFVNYLNDLPYFNQEVIARLERAGLRVAADRSAVTA
jgi:alkanesulfonate monooxygenase SsuD/methylene tetrahydromethanopterin reductase-like flavin-dependent oxidoreductase (luciferase family)